MLGSLIAAFRLSRGYRLTPWKSPYLRWRIETWSGLEADSITPAVFLKFTWSNRKDLFRYLHWASQKGG